MRRIRNTVAAALVVALLLVGVVQAQVLEQVPSNALVVLKVNHLKATSDKVAKLAADLGLAAMAAPLADPLGALQTELGMQAGVDSAGEMAFAFIDPEAVGGDPEHAMVILIPVTDYAAFLGNWADAKTEAGVSEVKLGSSAEPGFIANWGKYAALSPAKSILTDKKPALGLKSPAVAAKELAAKDAILFANFENLRGKLGPALKGGREQIMAELENGLKNEPQLQKYTPVIKVLVSQLLNVADEFLNDAQAATVGIAIVPEGINATVLAEFAPNTYIANIVTATKTTDGPLLTGLPQGKYLFFGGSVNDPKASTKVVSDLLDPILKELIAIGPEMASADEWSNALKAYMGAQSGQTFGMLAPSGAIGAEPLLQFVAIQNGDPKVLAESYTKMLDAQQQLMTALNIPGMAAVKPTRTAAAKTVDGVAFDTIVTKVDMNAQDPMAMQQAQMMNMLYGPQGAVVHYGTVGDKMLIVSGIGDPMISSVISAIKTKQRLAKTDRVAAVSKQLPAKRFTVLYVPVDDIATTGLAYAKQFGFPMNIQLPPDLPPIGVAGSTDATALKFDIHIPTTLVQSLVAAGMQAAMQMQGGGAPQGGGL